MELLITQTRSLIRATGRQRQTMQALGLRRIRHAVKHSDTPEIRGMLRRVAHLVTVESVPSPPEPES